MLYEAPRITIESIDGSGKSTVAKESAEALSQEYPNKLISVVDSEGIFDYADGALQEQRWSKLENLEPHSDGNKLARISKLGAFTLARRFAESTALREADLVIGVRDPYRIDPAAYSLVFGPKRMEKMSSMARLMLFDKFTIAPDPSKIIHLQADYDNVANNIESRTITDEHETVEKIHLIAVELPKILESYKKLREVPISHVTALTPSTTDEVISQIEPFVLPPEPASAYIPTAVRTQRAG